ncbi:HAD-IA family hydrolase [Aliikangiella marina]|uniref:HAD-IA family hydrolase n=1 Tax=Aliikangiella marina TaxID=1712262 RepID=A0A545T4A1_9GAMM|nr:HAD-IA family hydrolase [Aliikangiella marina]TQV72004.1 HAD-IA family hydrolase [Aliikangiella marina]TQV72057.1 HAD-IA family hydrolase [Aliikangiella marina]
MASTIKLISFDLDDALYDNKPVLFEAERLCNQFLADEFNRQNREFDLQNFYEIRHRLMESTDPSMENMTQMRQVAITEICQDLEDSGSVAAKALEIFLTARSNAAVPAKIHTMMERLAKQFTLVSVTNGNCDPNKLSIGQFFSKNYSPVEGFRAKPQPEMLLKVLDDFSLERSQVLHIGDSLDKDGLAAKNAGVSFYHFAPFYEGNTIDSTVADFEKYLTQ